MTVQELIIELNKVEDKTLDIVVNDGISETTDIEVWDKFEAYYGKTENNTWTSKRRKCVFIT